MCMVTGIQMCRLNLEHIAHNTGKDLHMVMSQDYTKQDC